MASAPESKSLPGNKAIGIRREDKSRWERRAPLAPQHVKVLVQRGVKVYIQPSNLRVFTDDEYREEDLSPAHTIIAVKVPKELLLEGRTYMYFSHTIKAQPSNMPMLDTILQKNIRLIDYEKICDAKGTRLVRFGKFAGFAGMIDMLRIIGERLLVLGFSTPFLNIGYAHMYSRLDEAKKAVVSVGEEIRRVGLPRGLTPMVFAFTGSTGNVARGALEIFNLLPHEVVTVDQLPKLVGNARIRMTGSGSWSNLQEMSKDIEEEDKKRRFTLYSLVLEAKDYCEPLSVGAKFDKAEYYAHPEKYKCTFASRILPYTSVLMNCAYWDQKFPRHVSVADIRELHKHRRNRLIGIADLSCDINGGVEFLLKSTSIDRPTFVYDIETSAAHDGFEGRGVILLGVDNLPTELPREATLYFGESLLPFIEGVARSDATKPVDKTDLPVEVSGAVVTQNGKLTPRFEYIAKLRAQFEKGHHNVLLLGSGMVAPPVVDYILRDSNNKLTVAGAELDQAKALVKEHSGVDAMLLDVNNIPELEALVGRHELVISLVPASLHVLIAKVCIKMKRNMVTASYISPEMLALDAEARAAGIVILNEVGLDPGIDHMSSMSIIADVKKQGGKVLAYTSVCGGLPAPEAADNPLGYKFSWSPKGVLLAGTRPAKYRKNGKVVEVAGPELFNAAQVIDVAPCFRLEVLPNRDSLTYATAYGLADVPSFQRGTLRYRGFSAVMSCFSRMGLFDDKALPFLANTSPDISWLLSKLLPHVEVKDLRTRVLRSLALESADKRSSRDRLLAAMDWFEMFDEANLVERRGTCIDSLCALLEARLTYEQEERDMVLLQHQFEIQWPDYQETRVSTLIAWGEVEGYTAMAKTVGMPTAVASQLILSGKIHTKGVVAPLLPEIYEPMLKALAEEGITFLENSTYSYPSA